MTEHMYVWLRDGGLLIRCSQGWTGTDRYDRGRRAWVPEAHDVRFEGHEVTPEAAERYMLTGIEPNRHDHPGRRPLRVDEARAAADALAGGEWPGMEGVREVLADYVEQHETDETDEADELPADPDPGWED